MIKITYEYICDVCKGPIRRTDTYECSGNPHYHMPQPHLGETMVGRLHCCEGCRQVAYEAIKKAFPRGPESL